jgi:tetratricopeptide (TPR) repeat protein
MRKSCLFIFVALSAGLHAQSAGECLRLGDNNLSDKRYEEAISYYDKVIRLNPKSAHAYVNRGVAKRYLLDLSGAMDDYDRAIDADRKSYHAYICRGALKSEMKNYYSAIRDLDTALLLHPDDPLCLVNRANAKKKVREYKGAIADCSEAIIADPSYGYAYYLRAEIRDRFLKPRQARAAIYDCDTAISLMGESTALLILRGCARSDAGDYTGSIVDYEAAMALDPSDAIAYIDRSDSRHHLRDYAGSTADCQVAISIDSTEPLSYINIGNDLDSLGDHKGAIEYYNRAIHFADDSVNTALGYSFRGESQMALGHPQDALQDYELAIRADPGCGEAYYARAVTNIKLKQNRGACDDLRKALELGKDEAEEFLIKYCK